MYRKLLSLILLSLMVVVVGCAQQSEAAPGIEEPAPPIADSDLSPAGVVERFYGWYLDNSGFDAESNTFHNPLVEGTYKESPYLTNGFVRSVEETLASFEGAGGGYDPILQAQDRPERFTVENEEISGDTAKVTLATFFSGNPQAHLLAVELKQEGGTWKIDNVTAGESAALAPEEVVKSFYDLYIGSINAARAAGEMRNYLADGSYRDLPYLSDEWIAEVDEILASFERGGYDPFLQAQDIPESFDVEAAQVDGERATVIVHTYWNGSDLVRDLEVELVQSESGWLIDAVAYRE